MKLKIVSRSGKELIAGGLTVPDGATVDDLKAAFHAAKRKFYPTRQRFTLPVPEGAPPRPAASRSSRASHSARIMV